MQTYTSSVGKDLNGLATESVAMSGLARRLVDDGILAAEAALQATKKARDSAANLVSYLVQNKIADASVVAASAAEEFGLPLMDLSVFDLAGVPKELVTEQLIRQHNALPLVRRGGCLFVAVSDPTNLQALDEIKFHTGVNTEPVLVEEDKLAAIIEQILNTQQDHGAGDLDGYALDGNGLDGTGLDGDGLDGNGPDGGGLVGNHLHGSDLYGNSLNGNSLQGNELQDLDMAVFDHDAPPAAKAVKAVKTTKGTKATKATKGTKGTKKDAKDAGAAADDTPVVRFVNSVLLDAIKSGASDIHFEPYETSYRVRFRTDGVLKVVATPPPNLGIRLAARLKVMSQMDISERRLPQDGRIRMKLSKTRAIDLRVNTLPTLWGEKVVLRILDPSSAKMGIEALGFEERQQEMFLDALHQPQGMILVTGPTGSGKTVSLYTGLNILNTAERNIATAEDPVEINLEGINQVHVNHRVGLDFAQALRSFLRQDPDVVMVGEIRDLETAEIAIKAAQTGHMVLSTLHTNSAPETLNRLRNMGVPPFNLATSVNLIIAQRLARRLCNKCKIPLDVPAESLLEEGFSKQDITSGVTIYAARSDGCDQCNAGYRGRVGIYEVVKITPEMSRIIMADGNSLQLAEQAEAHGFNNLRRSGLVKVMQGVTSLAEANRVATGH